MRDHLLFSSVPFLALTVNIDPDSQPLVFGERPVGNLYRNLAVLFSPLFNKFLRICPASVAIDNEVFPF